MLERSGFLRLEDAIERLMSRDRVLVGIDFDGTLAPIVDHPDDAVPDHRAVEALTDLAKRHDVEVAVISGRALDDLRLRLGDIPGATFVGEHGNDMGSESSEDPLITEAAEMIDELATSLGATAERKQRSVTFHYRNMAEEDAERALVRIRGWAQDRDGVRVLEGKKVIELTSGTHNKGDAIRELAGSASVIYIGDDTTDETVFEVLGPDDIGVKVGDGPTAATHRVEDIDGVVAILRQIALASG
jgi:trehalose 6-phosphate phosphatase